MSEVSQLALLVVFNDIHKATTIIFIIIAHHESNYTVTK